MIDRFNPPEKDFPVPSIYFDYNATCPVRPEVIAHVGDVMQHVGNPSSVHRFGRQGRKFIEEGRNRLAQAINVKPNQVIFNSGATEGNNTILHGFRNQVQFVSQIEHPSIHRIVGEYTDKAHFIPVLKSGLICLDQLQDMLAKHRPAIVSVMMVNNESGVMQPIADLVRIVKDFDKDIMVHSDMAQALGRIEIDFEALGLDFATLSSHKFGGPHGVGALVMKRGIQAPKLILGGGQERRHRAGTENVEGIAGMGLAAELCSRDLLDYQTRLLGYRTRIEDALRESVPNIRIYCEEVERTANTILFHLPHIKSDTALMNFDLEGVALSGGSACSSGSVQSSHVIVALGADENDESASIRLSMGWNTTQEEVDQFIAIWHKMAKRFNDKLTA